MKRSPKLNLPPFAVQRNGRQLTHQLCRALRHAIATGALPPGSRLPASRILARDLRVSRNTVLAAYEILSFDGLISGRVGSGTHVCALHPSLVRALAVSQPDQLRRLRESGFPLEPRAFRDPDGDTAYVHR